ncbi:phage holin family protein [Tessaracoccus rhinocerotis]|uniref:Phage holin family protein n=1 Tax=Tessaracoccus rhinocerotis TaxID=1689449 RepID=A0A553K4M7_9ACTN|nr:phage holin family protein [Tessaracoccus rhinocerotis]TRY19660.1 phage holin family protein [Tessaracoccus rhinocerotis]
MNLILKLIAAAVGTAVAVWLVPGISITASDNMDVAVTLLVVAAIIGVVNAVVKPFAQVVGFCLIILTLGLFLLVINALMLMLASWLAEMLGIGFHVDGFLSALIGSVIISIVSALVGGVLGVDRNKARG